MLYVGYIFTMQYPHVGFTLFYHYIMSFLIFSYNLCFKSLLFFWNKCSYLRLILIFLSWNTFFYPPLSVCVCPTETSLFLHGAYRCKWGWSFAFQPSMFLIINFEVLLNLTRKASVSSNKMQLLPKRHLLMT